jgi:bifunctional NMN adenylyltransferase/nudix hydrolase
VAKYDLAVVVARFQPVQNSHCVLLEHALAQAHRALALVGSSDAARTPKHPWSYAERAEMIAAALGPAASRVTTLPLRDHLYNAHRWRAETQAQVARVAGDAQSVALFCAAHDARAFPQWAQIVIDLPPAPSAEAICEALFADSDSGLRLIEDHTPGAVFDMISTFRRSGDFARLREEYRIIQAERGAWAQAPFPTIFVTVDAVVAHSGHVLLVERRHDPGRGLWALPGGFVEPHETVRDAAIRELREETMIEVSTSALLGHLRDAVVFDDPQRSLRGRTITHAFFFDFPSGDLPEVQGGDDAACARWVPMHEVSGMRSRMFEDHFFILEHFLGLD